MVQNAARPTGGPTPQPCDERRLGAGDVLYVQGRTIPIGAAIPEDGKILLELGLHPPIEQLATRGR